MAKKRLFVYAAVVLAFVLACTAPSLSNMIAGALITYDPAEIGTATLEDEGDTVFVRMAEFTFGEGEDEEKIVAPGFTVGDAANGDDPAANVDFDVLTPITKENRLTGELYKDVYVQNRDGEYTDLYLGDLTLHGKLYGSSGANLNLLGGRLTADTIETTGVISVVSADVTLREDLKGFRGLSLSASTEALNGDEANRPSTLTVWGRVENTLGVYYYEWSGTYDASIEVAHGSTLTVTDDISVVYPVVIHTTPGATQKSSLNVGGKLSVSKGYLGLTNARAEIYDNVNVKKDITLCDGSYLSAYNVTSDSSLHVSKHSNFDIYDKITLGGSFDIGYHDNAEEFKINGDLTCGTFTVIGKSDAAKITFTANGEINCNAFYVKYGVCDFNYDVKKTGSYQTFLLEYCDAKFNGNVSGPYFSMLESDVEINGDLKTLNGSSPIRNSTLKVNGDVESSSLNVLGSTVTINGELKNTSPLNVFKSFGKEGVLKVWGDITTNGVDVGIDAELTADSDLNSSSFVIVHQNSKLSVSGDAKSGSIFSVCSNSQAEISGDLEASTSIGIHDHNSELTVDGSIKSNNLWFFAPCTVDGDVTGASSPIIVEDKLSVGGDIDCNGYFLQVNGAECEIGGDVKNNAGFGLSYGFKTVNGASYVVPARVKVNGDVDMGRTGGPNAFCVVGSECEIGGRITKAASFGVHAASVYTNGAYASYTSDVKVDGSVEGTDYGSYRFFTVEGSDCEIGGEVSNITTFGVFDYYCYGDDGQPMIAAYYDKYMDIFYGIDVNTWEAVTKMGDVESTIPEIDNLYLDVSELYVAEDYYFVLDDYNELYCIERGSGEVVGTRQMRDTFSFTFYPTGWLVYVEEDSYGNDMLYGVPAGCIDDSSKILTLSNLTEDGVMSPRLYCDYNSNIYITGYRTEDGYTPILYTYYYNNNDEFVYDWCTTNENYNEIKDVAGLYDDCICLFARKDGTFELIDYVKSDLEMYIKWSFPAGAEITGVCAAYDNDNELVIGYRIEDEKGFRFEYLVRNNSTYEWNTYVNYTWN